MRTSNRLFKLLPVASLVILSGCVGTPALLMGNTNDIGVMITPSANGTFLFAEFSLASETASFNFKPSNSAQRKNDWRAETSDWIFDGTSVARADGGSFDKFTLHLLTDSRFFNRKYVAVDNIGGDSWTLFTPAFLPADGGATMEFTGFGKNAIVRDGDTSFPSNDVKLTLGSGEKMVYIGSVDHIHSGAACIVAGPEIPQWLLTPVATELLNVVERATERFGVEPQSEPTVYLSSRLDFPGEGWKGGTFDSGAIAIRLRGMSLEIPDLELAESIANTISHEAVHLWIGQRFESAVNEQQPWLHEGSTEYLADRIRLSSSNIAEEFGQRLNDCLLNLRDRTLDGSHGEVQGQSSYDCGYVINFVSELASLQAGNGDIATIWRETFSIAADSGFTPEDFLAVANAAGENKASDFIQRFLHGSGPSRWLGFEADLRKLGVTVSQRAPDQREGGVLRAMLLNTLLRSRCTGGYGFSTFDVHVELDTDDRCGEELKGNPEIDRIGGFHLFDQPLKAYQYAKRICAASGYLVLQTTGGSTPITVRCDSPVPALAPIFELTDVPELPRI